MIKTFGKISLLFLFLLAISILFADFVLYPVMKAQVAKPEIFSWILITLIVVVLVVKGIMYFHSLNKNQTFFRRALRMIGYFFYRIGKSFLSFLLYVFSFAVALFFIILLLNINSFLLS